MSLLLIYSLTYTFLLTKQSFDHNRRVPLLYHIQSCSLWWRASIIEQELSIRVCLDLHHFAVVGSGTSVLIFWMGIRIPFQTFWDKTLGCGINDYIAITYGTVLFYTGTGTYSLSQKYKMFLRFQTISSRIQIRIEIVWSPLQSSNQSE
jgi:hypothetical protein